MKAPSSGYVPQPLDGERRSINSELWHACAGPLVSLPPVGSLVVYFPQGHLEQVAASMQKESDGQIPNYQNLPSKLICQLHNVTLHADVETDQVYAQMTLQPVNTADKDALLASDLGLKQSKQPTEFFCKTLTASDTSTHGGFSVPRRSAEKFFPPLDYSMQPPAQELVARDLHDNVWTFRHIYRGQPKRHLLTTGWSVFVSAKRLLAGDSVLFVRDEKSQLLLGIRRANRQQAPMLSSVLSSDSMHIGVLAAAAHAASNHSPFTVFYNPRASCSEFVIPWSKYNKALYGTQISLGMRFRMMFETEESGVRRYMGTITDRSDLDPVRWPNSEWRNIQVGWDESSVGERQNRVSIWEIEPVATPFFICPPPFFRPKRPRQPGMLGEETDLESTIKRALPWLGEEISIGNSPNSTIPGIGLVEWMSMQQRPEIIRSTIQSEYYRPMAAATLQKLGSNETSKQLSSPQQALQPRQMQFGAPQPQHSQQQEHLQQSRILVPQQHHNHNPQQQQQNLHTQQQMLLQKVEPQNLQAQQQIPLLQVDQQQVLSQKVNLQHQPLQHLQQQSLQQLHQQLQQLQQQSHPQSTLPLPQLAQQQQQHQRLQQLQQPLAQLQQQDQRLQQPPQQVQQQPPRQVQQQQQLLQPSQQFHQHQTQTLPPSQQHVPNQILQHLHNQQKQHLQQSIQLPEIQGQLLQSSSSQSQGPVNMPLVPKVQTGFTDTASCSASISYPLQNILSRTNQCASTSEERTQYTNMPRPNPSGAQAVMPVSNVVLEPPVTSWFPSIKEQNQAAVQTYLTGQLGQMETTTSSGASYSLTQADAIVPQSFPLLPLQSSPFLFTDVSHETDIQNDVRNNFLFGVNIENPLIVPSTSAPLLTGSLSAGKDTQNHVSAGNVLPSFGTGKDVQPQIASPPGSQSFTVSDLPFHSGVGSDGGMHDSNYLQRGPWQQPLPTMRTYTKVYKHGSVGRSIDVTRCKNYHELRCELARMFGLEGQLEDPQRSGWQLVFVDNECDVLLVGDDPWEEFVSCVRCIRILSPNEVLPMGQENMEPLNTIPLQQQTGSSSDGAIVWRDSCDQNSTNPSAGSLEH